MSTGLHTPDRRVLTTQDIPYFLIPASHKATERFRQNTDMTAEENMVLAWLTARPDLMIRDSSVPLTVRNTLQECAESQEELEKPSALRNERKVMDEMGDVKWILLSLVVSRGMRLDHHRIRSLQNGEGSRTGILDRVAEVTGNLVDNSQLPQELEYLLSLVNSAFIHVPRNPVLKGQDLLQQTFKKDKLNYPAIYFSGIDPRTGHKLNPEGMNLQYEHARTCIRWLRRLLRAPKREGGLGLSDRDFGLEDSDHLPYQEMISRFWDSKNAFLQFQQAVTRDQARFLPRATMRAQESTLSRSYVEAVGKSAGIGIQWAQ